MHCARVDNPPAPRYHVIWDRYGHARVVLVVGRGAALRIVDARPKLATAHEVTAYVAVRGWNMVIAANRTDWR